MRNIESERNFFREKENHPRRILGEGRNIIINNGRNEISGFGLGLPPLGHAIAVPLQKNADITTKTAR
jgi:hypothetical protein